VKVHITRSFFASKYVAPTIYTLMAKKLKRKYDVDIVIGNGYTLWDDITWIHFLRLPYAKNLKNIVLNKIPRRLLWEARVEKYVLGTSHRLWAVSNMVKRNLMEDYGSSEKKIFVLYPGIDVNKYRPLEEEEKERFRAQLGLKDNLVLLFVGRDPVGKGFFRMVKALKESKLTNKATLLVVGFELDKLQSVNLPDFNTKFLGVINEEEMIRLYQISDILVYPSYYDTFSLTVLEAMATGVVPIVSSTTGSSEIINNGIDGFVFHSDKELVEILNSIEKIDLDSMKRRARQKALQFSWVRIAKSLIEMLSMETK